MKAEMELIGYLHMNITINMNLHFQKKNQIYSCTRHVYFKYVNHEKDKACPNPFSLCIKSEKNLVFVIQIFS